MQQRKLRRFTFKEIINELRTNPHLVDLEIQPFTTEPMLNNIVDGVFSNTTHEELMQLTDALQKNISLKCIRINYTAAEETPENLRASAVVISDSLKNHPALKTLIINFSRSDIEEETIFKFLRYLTGSAKIENFHLQIWRGTPIFLNHLGEMLQKKIVCEKSQFKAPISLNIQTQK